MVRITRRSIGAFVVSTAMFTACTMTSTASSTSMGMGAGVRVQEVSDPSPIETDRRFGEAAPSTDLVSALTAMMRADVIMPAPPGRFHYGIDSVRAALRLTPANATARVAWSPVGGGVSTDGTHGFTYGYMTVTNADGRRLPLKYMTYWTRGSDGWRASVFKRALGADTGTRSTARAAIRPSGNFAVARDAASLARHRASLSDAERDFAREAQSIGLQAAFVKYGSPLAVNMGGGQAPFVFGNENIGRAVGEGSAGQPSPLNWGPDTALVAPSGDLGITLGFIRQNANANANGAAQRPTQGAPFFTIWWRASPGAPWRYVAE